MPKRFFNLVDITLIPAAIMVVGKLFGLFLATVIFDLNIEIKSAQEALFTVRPTILPEQLAVASTYSDLAMYIILATGFSIILLQATHFHDTHIRPRMLMSLSNNNLLGLVKGSFELYHRAAIWLLILWVAFVLIVLNVALERTEIWLAIAAFVGNIFFTSMLLQDVYNEIEMGQKTLGNKEALS